MTKIENVENVFLHLCGLTGVFAGALCAAKVLRAVTPVDAGGLLGCTVTGDGVGQLRGLVVELACSLIFVFVVCAGLIGGGGAAAGDEGCRAASVASTEGSEYLCSSSRQVAAPFVAGATVTGLSVFAVRMSIVVSRSTSLSPSSERGLTWSK